MSLADDVDLEELVMTKDDLSGADIKAVCSAWCLASAKDPAHSLQLKLGCWPCGNAE